MPESELLQVDLSPAEEDALRKLAAAQGLSIEDLAAQIITARVASLEIEESER